jgi:3-isopropylmalate/(R)-2-methylmalate dehydratase small subunit
MDERASDESVIIPIRLRRLEGAVSTDDILPAIAKHMSIEPSELARSLFANLSPEFGASLRPGDVIVSDGVFGIGSSREQAPQALRAAGVRGIIAPDFGAIFYRNAWNSGLFAIKGYCNGAPDGERAVISLIRGTLETSELAFTFSPPRPMFLALFASGGLLQHIAKYGNLYR